MALWRITVAYDGTDFAGWQAQGETVPSRTVQATAIEVIDTYRSQAQPGEPR